MSENAHTIAEIQTMVSQLLVRVRLNTDAIGGVRHLLEGYRGQVQFYVARAVAAANPNNPDPAALQGALDNLNTLNAEIDAQAAAEAAIFNTDAPDASTTDPTLTNAIVTPVEKPASVDASSLPGEAVVPATPTTPAEVPVEATPLPDSTQQEMQAGSDQVAAAAPVEAANPAPGESEPGTGVSDSVNPSPDAPVDSTQPPVDTPAA